MGFQAAGRAGGDRSSSCLSMSFLPVALGLVGFRPRDLGIASGWHRSFRLPAPAALLPQEAAPLFPLLDSSPEDRNLKTNKNQSFW